MAAQTFIHENIIAKVNREIIPNKGLQIIDSKRKSDSEISLYKTDEDNTLFLDLNRFHDSRQDDNIKENLKNIVVVARQIAIELKKNVVVSDSIRTLNKNIFNFIKYNDLSVPMFIDELKNLHETTGKDIEMNLLPLNKMDIMSIRYFLIVQRGQKNYDKDIDYIPIPEGIPVQINNEYINRDMTLFLKEENNCYDNVNIEINPYFDIKEILISINKDRALITSPKINCKKDITVYSELGACFPTYEMFKGLLEENCKFTYQPDRFFSGFGQNKLIEDIINNQEALNERIFHNLKGFVKLVDYFSENNLSFSDYNILPIDMIMNPECFHKLKEKIIKDGKDMETQYSK